MPRPQPRAAKDLNIRLAILEGLYWDLAIPPGAVTVEVVKGRVVMRGRVARAFARHRAEWAARDVPGVNGVENAIIVAG